MSSVTSLRDVVDIVIGVDTHVQTHSAAAIDTGTGAVLGEISIEANAQGYRELEEFAAAIADEHAALQAFAIEGTASHGRGLSAFLDQRDQLVIEVDRPQRAARRGGVKSDPADAIRAAREALSRERLATPRSSTRSGNDPEQAAIRQALATRLAIRRSAVQGAGDARRQLFSAIMTAPEPVRARLRGLRAGKLVAKAASLNPKAAWSISDTETAELVACLRVWARRIQQLQKEAADHERAIRALVRRWRPDLLAELGIGPIVAAIILCAWGHAGRIHSDGAFAKLAGTSPIEATSGQIHTRHRLNRYGDRQLNAAMHTIVISRQRLDSATIAYTDRRTSEGKTPREIRRCLKRYVTRHIYRILETENTPRQT